MSKAKQSDTDQQQFWMMVLETFKPSGLSVRQFCQQEGLSEPSFYSWRKRLTHPRKPDVSPEPPKQESFIQVSVPHPETDFLEFVLHRVIHCGYRWTLTARFQPVFFQR